MLNPQDMEAIKAMTPQELNILVASRLAVLTEHQRMIKEAQELCQAACLKRLAEMEERVQVTERGNAKLSGWMKGLWLVIGGILAVVLASLWGQRR